MDYSNSGNTTQIMGFPCRSNRDSTGDCGCVMYPKYGSYLLPMI